MVAGLDEGSAFRLDSIARNSETGRCKQARPGTLPEKFRMLKRTSGLLLLAVLVAVPARAGDIEYLLAIDGIRDNAVSGQLEHNLLLIARYDGEFHTVDKWERESGLWSLRPYLLSEFPVFGVYRHGHAIAEITANRREVRPYFCNSLVVVVEDADRAGLGSVLEKVEAVTGVTGWANGTEIDYASYSLLALGGAFDAAVEQPMVAALSPDALQVALPQVETASESEPESRSGFHVSNGEMGDVQVLSVSRELEHGFVSNAWVRDAVGELHSLETVRNSASSWGKGYTFIDAFRFKAEGSVYLLFEVTYYESVGYNVYELDRATGKPEFVFETIAYGC